MANPVPYDRSYAFSPFQADSPTTPLPAPQLDNELVNIETTLDSLVGGLMDIRRSDGRLVNGIVTSDSLSAAVLAGLGGDAIAVSQLAIDAAAAAAASQATTTAARDQVLTVYNSLVDVTVDTIAALLAVSSSLVTTIRTRGYYAAGDGGGGVWVKNAGSPTYYRQAANGFKYVLDVTLMGLPEQVGARGDGSTNDTTAVQEIMNVAAWVYFKSPSGYKCGTLTPSSLVRRLSGPGVIYQAAAGSNGLNVSSRSDLEISVSMTGVASLGTVVGASSNSAIYGANVARINVHRCTLRRWLFNPVRFEAGTDCRVDYSIMLENAFGPLFQGVTRGSISFNTLKDSALLISTFTSVITLDSTDAQANGICQYVDIVGNKIFGYGFAQGILAHAGKNILIRGNYFNGCSMGVYFGPYNPTDVILDITIDNNEFVGTVGPLPDRLGFGGDDGIVVRGGLDALGRATPNPLRINITNNRFYAVNRTLKVRGYAAIRFGVADNVVCTGNNISACGGGIVVDGPTTSFIIGSNQINDTQDNLAVDNVTVVPGIAIHFTASAVGSIGMIDANMVRNSSIGLQIDNSITAHIAPQVMSGVATPFVNPGLALYVNTLSSTSTSATVDASALGGQSGTIYLNAAGSYTISDISNYRDDQEITIIQRGAGTITVSRAGNFLLDGGTNVSLATNSLIKFKMFNGKGYMISKGIDS